MQQLAHRLEGTAVQCKQQQQQSDQGLDKALPGMQQLAHRLEGAALQQHSKCR
jgi:hypothetical protein